MAIAPIHGMLRRSAIKHVTLGLSSGLAGGFTFWYGWHIPQVRRRDEWYLEQERRKQAGEA